LTTPFFEQRKRIIEQHYADRFICGFIDPGPFLIAFNLFGYDGLLLQLCDDLELVKAVIRKIVDYQLALVPKFAAMGAHMVNIIDEVAGTAGLMFSPEQFRRHFLPMFGELIAEIHRHNMYASLLLDGNISAILPDMMALELDQILFAQPLSTGIDTIADFCRGKRCVKMAVDMMVTLAKGTAADIDAEVKTMVEKLNTPKGGLVFQALRWHRPEYDAQRVEAQIQAMNRYRGGAL
jgi:uroporphyrinogen-III decarboxylase